MSASEERPQRPQFGEYASVEEQKKRMGVIEPSQPLSPVLEPVSKPEAAPEHPDAVKKVPALPKLNFDRYVTLFLLIYGLIMMFSNIPMFTDYYALASSVFAQADISSEPVNLAAGHAWGIAAALVMGLGWLATALLCWFRFKAGKSSWWIALVAGIVINLLCVIFLAIPLSAEPELLNSLLRTPL